MSDSAGDLLVYPRPSPDLARLLDLAGRPWCAVADDLEARNAEGEPCGAIVELVDRGFGTADPASENDGSDPAWAVLTALARREPPLRAVLVLVGGTRLGELEGRDDLFADFCLTPFHPAEAAARSSAAWSRGRSARIGSGRSPGSPTCWPRPPRPVQPSSSRERPTTRPSW